MSASAVLDQGVGYGVVIGMGLFFSALMIGLTVLQSRYTPYKASSSDEFTSASRSVKPGLIASGIVSAWTWAATLLQSSAVAYKFGLSGPWWYAAGATVQILLFAMNAAKLKLNAPFAHTPFEVIRKRWGTIGHCVILFFAVATNIIVSSMLILGGSATVTDLTGMNTLAACFLIPFSVAIYVIVGGMRATLLCDYTHTTVLFAIILTFMFTVYATSDLIGSPQEMWRLLQAVSAKAPVSGNAEGSYVTMSSLGGGIFGIINVIGNFATVYLDQAYWQRAVASKPSSAVKAYLLGGIAWISVPFGMATTMGLAAVALQDRFPAGLTAQAVSSGLAAPTAAAVLLGKSGAALILVLLFLAVTSATSAELIAISSVFTYDVYLPYVNPRASDKQIFWATHISIGVAAICMGFLGLIFYYIGISMGWLYEFMGTVLGSAVPAVALAVMSSRANKWGCIASCIIGFGAGLIAWLVTASTLNGGVLSVETTGQDYPMLAGNLAAIGVGFIIAVGSTLIWPQEYIFDRAYQYNASGTISSEISATGAETPDLDSDKRSTDEKSPGLSGVKEAPLDTVNVLDDPDLDETKLKKAFRFACICSLSLFVVLLILIPFPLVFSKHVYGPNGFAAWVAVSFILLFNGAFIVILYPIYESRVALKQIFGGIVKDLFGGNGKLQDKPVEAA